MIINNIIDPLFANDPEMEDMSTGSNKYRVFYRSHLDDQGRLTRDEIVDLIKAEFPNRQFQNCLEWSAGVGFMGFDLLDHGVCQHLHLIEKYAPAVESATKTIDTNSLGSKATCQLADSITGISPRQFDLIVASPPQFKTFALYNSSFGEYALENWYDANCERMCVDTDWQEHVDFFAHCLDYLTNDGVIVLVEHESHIAEIETMVTAGLTGRRLSSSMIPGKLTYLILTRT